MKYGETHRFVTPFHCFYSVGLRAWRIGGLDGSWWKHLAALHSGYLVGLFTAHVQC